MDLIECESAEAFEQAKTECSESKVVAGFYYEGGGDTDELKSTLQSLAEEDTYTQFFYVKVGYGDQHLCVGNHTAIRVYNYKEEKDHDGIPFSKGLDAIKLYIE